MVLSRQALCKASATRPPLSSIRNAERAAGSRERTDELAPVARIALTVLSDRVRELV